jgi:hypothetical protein
MKTGYVTGYEKPFFVLTLIDQLILSIKTID